LEYNQIQYICEGRHFLKSSIFPGIVLSRKFRKSQTLNANKSQNKLMTNIKKKDTRLTFIDLFAGCGGLSEGFLQSGNFEALAHVEWETPMVDTLRNRLVKKWEHSVEDAKKRVIHFDIQKTTELINGNWEDDTIKTYGSTNDELIKAKGLRSLIGNQKVNLIIGGPPCQAYSIAGRAQDKNSMQNDYRNYLFESFVKVVDEFKPDVFVFENVPGLLSAKPGDKAVTERIFEAFSKIGYEIRNPALLKKSVYTASDLGVPQKRNRVIIIGVNCASKINLQDLYNEIDKQKENSIPQNVFDAIGHLPKFQPLKEAQKHNGKNVSHQLVGENNVKYHESRFHNNRDVKIFRTWIKEGMNKSSTENKIAFYNNLMGKQSNHSKYRNLEWDKLSPTIVAHLYKDGLMFIHPDQNQARSITAKEAALLQSFPDDYEFISTQGYAFKMIGNAVPPEMAKKIAIAISNIISTK
jgi:DNA (cytosine-5)-methyltransferase 1